MAAPLNLRLHWALAGLVLLVDVVIVATTIVMDKLYHVEPPASGAIDLSSAIGWLGVGGAVFIFGCYGILIKTPAVEETKCDCMVFQCYVSAAVAIVSLFIWAVAGGSTGLHFTGSSFSMGLAFASLWIVQGLCAYKAILAIGYAVGPAIWIGVTICTSFFWGAAVFHNPIHSWPCAVGALVLMVVGGALAAASSVISDRQEATRARELTFLPGRQPGSAETGDADLGGTVSGVASALLTGLCNGTLMVSLTCFQDGCPAIGVEGYTGPLLAPLAFLPSLAAGLLVAQPVLFFLYWGRSMMGGIMPQFHASKVAACGLLTGVFWGMANFNAMFATVYLGQTVGFPLTQCCLILNGVWGIVYYREIKGAAGVGTFLAAAVALLAGARLDGMAAQG